MIEFKKYTSLRLKLLEGCQLSCRFCHHEGNDAAKLVKVDEVVRVANQLRHTLGLDKIHLTGGEPTLYPHLLELSQVLANNGFRMTITSHGLFSEKIFQHLYQLMTQGVLESINFSIHTLDPAQYLIINNLPHTEEQHRKAQQALNIITEHAAALSQIGTVNINCVVAHDESSLNDMFRWARQRNITLRLVPDWTALVAAHQTIGRFLHRHQAQFSRFVVVHPTSNYSANYLIDGVEVSVKLIRPVGVKTMCDDCSFAAHCTEFFGNVRLEGHPLHVRLCIHRQGWPYNQPWADFLNSPQVDALRISLNAPFPDPDVVFNELKEPFGILDGDEVGLSPVAPAPQIAMASNSFGSPRPMSHEIKLIA